MITNGAVGGKRCERRKGRRAVVRRGTLNVKTMIGKRKERS